MSPTLNLVDHLLALGRRYQDLGQGRDALRIFTRLSSFRELPAEAAEEAQARLAELQLKRRKYRPPLRPSWRIPNDWDSQLVNYSIHRSPVSHLLRR